MSTTEGARSKVAASTADRLVGEPSSPGITPSPASRTLWRGHLAAITAALLPLAYCLIRGATGASLWLDEILYYNFERHPAVRAVEMGVPGSVWAKYLGNFAYCDFMKGVHAGFDFVGFHIWRNPELYLRLPSIVSFAAGVVVLYALSLRVGRDRLWAAGVALAFGSTPGFLFYAFEARVYSFATLLVILFLACLVRVLEGGGWKFVGLGAVAGLLVAWSHPWNACLLAGLGLCLPILMWLRGGLALSLRTAAMIAAGSVLTVLQAAYIFSIRVPGQHGITFLEPQPWKSVLWSTVYGPFLGLLRGDPEYVLLALLAISLWRTRVRHGWCIPAATALALAISVIGISKIGSGISPRHQMALYGGIFVSLAVMRAGYVSKALLANIIGINLVLLFQTVPAIRAKGNAGEIARVITASPRLRTAPVVVQHSYGFGYPDPLHSFPLSFYLAGDGLPPGAPATPILELPTHREVHRVWIDRDYFLNGPSRLGEFSRAPVEEWTTFLRGLSASSLWLVAPKSSPIDIAQEKKYEIALKNAGFVRAPSVREFTGHPPTRLILWQRRQAR